MKSFSRARKAKAQGSGALPESEELRLALAHVLVVEDDPLLAMSTEDILRSAGVERVDVCPTTTSALEVLRTMRPDALVLDVHLSDRNDGWAIAELVKTLGDANPRIVFSTGAPQDIPAEIAEMGTILVKPYRPEELLTALRGPAEKGLFNRLRDAMS